MELKYFWIEILPVYSGDRAGPAIPRYWVVIVVGYRLRFVAITYSFCLVDILFK
ncbi:hypothetical protein D3C85_1678600 [compost metagenome]